MAGGQLQMERTAGLGGGPGQRRVEAEDADQPWRPRTAWAPASVNAKPVPGLRAVVALTRTAVSPSGQTSLASCSIRCVVFTASPTMP